MWYPFQLLQVSLLKELNCALSKIHDFRMELLQNCSIAVLSGIPPNVCAGLIRERCVDLMLFGERLLALLLIELPLNSFIHLFHSRL